MLLLLNLMRNVSRVHFETFVLIKVEIKSEHRLRHASEFQRTFKSYVMECSCNVLKLRSDCQPKYDFVYIRMESDLNN